MILASQKRVTRAPRDPDGQESQAVTVYANKSDHGDANGTFDRPLCQGMSTVCKMSTVFGQGPGQYRGSNSEHNQSKHSRPQELIEVIPGLRSPPGQEDIWSTIQSFINGLERPRAHPWMLSKLIIVIAELRRSWESPSAYLPGWQWQWGKAQNRLTAPIEARCAPLEYKSAR